MILERLTWQTGVPMPRLYATRAALVGMRLGGRCPLWVRRQLALYALAARIRRAFEVCR